MQMQSQELAKRSEQATKKGGEQEAMLNLAPAQDSTPSGQPASVRSRRSARGISSS